tara:strand:- start:574 stop:1359 length:786 start_codon:yes stop_codon:yes gene_type:complete
MDIYKYINDLDIGMDETRRMDCPVCKGNNTFTITNNKGMRLWNCYKISCSVGGSVKTNMTVDDIKIVYSSTVKTDSFVVPEYFIPFERDVNFCVSYKFSEIYNQFCEYDAKEDRAVFKIYDDEGFVVDAVGRSLSKRLPKWKRYGNSKIPFVRGLHNPITKEVNTTCVLVEDCISACVISNYGYAGVALLGTSLLEEHKHFLSSKFKKIIVALDPDALPKALTIRKELQSWVDTVKILRITDDLKYENEIDIANLKEIIWN